MSKSDLAESAVRDIRRKTRKQYSAEEKIRIVVSSLRGEERMDEYGEKHDCDREENWDWTGKGVSGFWMVSHYGTTNSQQSPKTI